MEMLSIDSLSSLSIREATDIHQHFSERQLNEQLHYYQKAMAGQSRVSNVHKLCNDETDEKKSPSSQQLASPKESSRQHPLPPYESLSLPRLPGFREMERDIRALDKGEGTRMPQQPQSTAQTPTYRSRDVLWPLSPPGTGVTSSRPSHQRILSDPQLHGLRSNSALRREHAKQTDTTSPIYRSHPAGPYSHSQREGYLDRASKPSHSRQSSGVDRAPIPAYTHSRNDSATDLCMPAIPGHPLSMMGNTSFPSPTATSTMYNPYNLPPPSRQPMGEVPGLHPHNLSPVQSIIPPVAPSTLGHSRSNSLFASKKRRGNLPKHAVRMLKKWVDEHKDNPYPNEEEKTRFCQETGLSTQQINNWFINARRRNLTQEERERMRRNRTEASGSQSPDSRPHSAHSNEDVSFPHTFARPFEEAPGGT